MTDTTIPPLTEADVRALGFTRFGREREDDMGGSLAHRDGEAYYMQRAAAFWSIDPEYGNMRNVLCEEPPNWRAWRDGCCPWYSYSLGSADRADVYVWRVFELPAGAVERLFNYDTIAPVLAGLRAQAEPTLTDAEQRDVIAAMPLQAFPPPAAPTKRRPLVVGDRVLVADSDNYARAAVVVDESFEVETSWGGRILMVRAGERCYEAEQVDLILPREGE